MLKEKSYLVQALSNRRRPISVRMPLVLMQLVLLNPSYANDESKEKLQKEVKKTWTQGICLYTFGQK